MKEKERREKRDTRKIPTKKVQSASPPCPKGGATAVLPVLGGQILHLRLHKRHGHAVEGIAAW